jgi:C-terminal processing protease CtpA/Prc
MRNFTLMAGLLIAILFANSALSEEPANTIADETLRVERLAATAKLWAVVKYFHPYVAYRDIDWDGALLKAIPKINAAKNAAEYASAVGDMLDVLQDPLTRIVKYPPPPGKDSAAVQSALSDVAEIFSLGASLISKTSAKLTDDKILIITLSSSPNWDVLSKELQKACEELPKARAVVFDLRSAVMSVMRYAFSLSGIAGRLTAKPVEGPAVRTRCHSGYANPEHWGTGNYYSFFAISDTSAINPASEAKDLPVVFLTNTKAGVAQDVLALAGAGKAKIVTEGPLSEEGHVPTNQIELPGGITVRVRLGELVYEDGTTGIIADATAPKNKGLDVALEYARDPKKPSEGTRPRLSPVTVPRSESAYADMEYPAAEYRVLAAMRIWSVYEFFYIYKDLMGEDWDAVLKEFIPKMEAARDAKEYTLAVMEMVTHVHDSHAVVSGTAFRDEYAAAPPLVLRWIEESPVVVALTDKMAAQQAGIQRGDVILKIEGEDVKNRIDWWSKYFAASTPQALMYRVMRSLLRGPEGMVTITVRDQNGAEKEVELPRKKEYVRLMAVKRKGDIIKMLPGNVGYVDLDRLTVPMVDGMFNKFKDTQAIIFDMRGYPADGTAWAIAPRLTEKKNVNGARFERPLAMYRSRPDEIFHSAKQIFYQKIPDTDKSVYKGRTVMLINERAVSSAEHTGLFFEAANGTKFIGSPTMGANGDITLFFVPGGIRVLMTGQGVTHADGRQLQRVGLVPDVAVKPTIAGVRQGRDEVLEKALEYLGVKLTEPLKGVGEAL